MSDNAGDLYDQFPVVLFDIDGTLTDHRRPITQHMVSVLIELSSDAQLGFVTGSPLLLIEEQLALFFNGDNSSVAENVDIFPCNGTQHFFWDSTDGKFACIDTVSMRDHLGLSHFRKLIISIQEGQHYFMHEFALKHDLPLCGNFIDYRGSLLNWCPIGRMADFDEREKFIKLDAELGIRDTLMSKFLGMIGDMDTVANLGGQTSFDIFPSGWDKTFCLRGYGSAAVWFVGDRCFPGGNDFEIFDLLNKDGRAYSTSSPKETVKIIRQKIIPEIKQFLGTRDQ